MLEKSSETLKGNNFDKENKKILLNYFQNHRWQWAKIKSHQPKSHSSKQRIKFKKQSMYGAYTKQKLTELFSFFLIFFSHFSVGSE